MADPFIGEIRQFPYSFSPWGFAHCSGQILSAEENQVLFAVIFNQFGGNGRTTMGLPNLQGRSVMHYGAGPGLTPNSFADNIGSCSVQLSGHQIPPHKHSVMAVQAPIPVVKDNAEGSYLASAAIKTDDDGTRGMLVYGSGDGGVVDLANETIGIAGQGGHHENRQPYIAISFCIALEGVYPARN
jgi:microcystin-dependent protein